ncbi:hypothetical protein IJ103_00010 [Candidatus Saccharibacteria bacterium]|nr:hypothetical protein [Candidatus Saccharibacteria bacterium]
MTNTQNTFSVILDDLARAMFELAADPLNELDVDATDSLEYMGKRLNYRARAIQDAATDDERDAACRAALAFLESDIPRHGLALLAAVGAADLYRARVARRYAAARCFALNAEGVLVYLG